MTDSDGSGGGGGLGLERRHGQPIPDKRQRLVEGARLLLHQQGVEKTTLADIAQAADVPAGNVYYYFKTKDELVQAAIDAQAQDIQTALASLDRRRSPKARLKAFLKLLTSQRELAARYGCPHGTLCSELDKRDDDLGQAGAKLMQLWIDWAERQFRSMGRRDARDLAVALIASYQGIMLLTNAFHQPELVVREARRLDRWIDSLA
jgi:TetR/AcrR family transcriptional regulator, transcriptional repressor for nem operon